MLGVVALLSCLGSPALHGQGLEQQLLEEPLSGLAEAAERQGDAQRGAIVFHQRGVGCASCHLPRQEEGNGQQAALGPNLSVWSCESPLTDTYLVESILKPSANIRAGYRAVSVLRTDGTVIKGMPVSGKDEDALVLRDLQTFQDTAIAAGEIEEVIPVETSPMPSGAVNTLSSRQQFFDLVKYLMEIRDGGPDRAQELKPAPELYAFKVPDYESHVDHAGLLKRLDDDAFQRGEAIYQRLCVNCHGTLQEPGSLPTAPRFAEGEFRSGSDPHTMYQTLTHGFGLMVPQTWMVPRQKYDVIHYIRETFLRPHQPKQYREIDDAYLASLPAGDTLGPEPVEFAPWRDMDYGPWMFNTVEVGRDGGNIAYKGLAVRLDPGPGGVARGNEWILFDHDTMRVAAAWQYRSGSDQRFIDWQGIHFDGRHQAHPHLVGEVLFANPNGPGWADPQTGSFEDDQRVLGRDQKRYGPLPDSWVRYRGMRHSGHQVVVDYEVGDMGVQERFQLLTEASSATSDESSGPSEPIFLRTLQLQPTKQRHSVLLATASDDEHAISNIDPQSIHWRRRHTGKATDTVSPSERAGRFDRSAWLQVEDASSLEMASADFSLTARVRTGSDGVLFAKTLPDSKWVPNGCALFIRGGRLTYDIGWVGAIRSSRRIDDQKWHDVALVFQQSGGTVRLFVDGEQVGQGELAPRAPLAGAVARIGYGAPNFPQQSAFSGRIADLRFYQRALSASELSDRSGEVRQPVAHWLANGKADTRSGPAPTVVRDGVSADAAEPDLLVGTVGDRAGTSFRREQRGLCLDIPPAAHVRTVTIWLTASGAVQDDRASVTWSEKAADVASRVAAPRDAAAAIEVRQRAADPLWPARVTTVAARGEINDSGFAVDILRAPENNPWLARMRFGGLDFFPDGNRLAICTWDGDVYEVSGLAALDQADGETELSWRRIASGLFQPLGLKVIDNQIYLTCRDQLVILHDDNQDGATDFYECLNNDQQVTEHFHEFAMGLQRDDEGNFYYAKSARHALPAIVPHHGTLLKVSPDGSQTEIVANGFRAANGVCLNPDGSFIVTDQEGHWTPKNRINLVHPGGFYGNMLGYHDVQDRSDEAMEQPICWITNEFDRSPAEPLRVAGTEWGNLTGTLLNLSYGYGKVYTVPFEKTGDGGAQGAMCELPLPQFPTGIIRGRFHPTDQQLYVCGLYAWASSQQAKEGGLYRIRYRGSGAAVPVDVSVESSQLSFTFSDPLDPQVENDLNRFEFRTWSLQRTKNYGSKHIDEQRLAVRDVALSENGRTLTLTIPALRPTWCYSLRARLRTSDGRPIERLIHGTIHTAGGRVK